MFPHPLLFKLLMASYFHFLLFSALFLFSLSQAQSSFKPKGLVLPVLKDAKTLQYLTTINQRTPLVPLKLVVDLGGRYQWVNCDEGYISSSYHPVTCGAAQCTLANALMCMDCYSSPPRPGCNNNTCDHMPENTVTGIRTNGDLIEDVLSLQSTDGSNPGTVVTVHQFLFSCAPTWLLDGLAVGAKGMAGLGRNRVAFQSQFAVAFSFHRKFAICLSSSTTGNGAIFFGNGPYVMLPGIDVSKSLIYTPLILNPVSTAGSSAKGEPSAEYYIGVKSIKINDIPISINASLLSISKKGVGGTKISTVKPYSTLATPIHKAFSEAFIRWANSSNIAQVAQVAPFNLCFSSKNIASTRVGLAVPTIDLVLQSENVSWKIFGANSMVSVRDGVLCLAFIDGGELDDKLPIRSAIVLGGYQLENNLLLFDLAYSRLGFSSSLLFGQTTCANFNFTSNA